jgi:hypothetical protein
VSNQPLCLGKVAFDTFTLATKAFGRSKAKLSKGSIYRCTDCNKFHVGTSIVSHGKLKNNLLKHQQGKQNGRSSD